MARNGLPSLSKLDEDLKPNFDSQLESPATKTSTEINVQSLADLETMIMVIMSATKEENEFVSEDGMDPKTTAKLVSINTSLSCCNIFAVRFESEVSLACNESGKIRQILEERERV